jgi:hypothetical protein
VRSLKKIFLAFGIALSLGGCVLQSKTPLISKSLAKPLLKTYGLKFANFNFADGRWQKEDKGIQFAIKNDHYVAVDGSSKVDVVFAPLDGVWWLAQYQETNDPLAYGLIEAKKDALYLHPLACKEIQKLPVQSPSISFVKDDCFAQAGMNFAEFKKLIPAAGPPMLKLVPEK